MTNSRPIIDSGELKDEMQEFEKKFQSVYYNLIAVALDYKSYIDPKIKNSTIYSLRDNIIFRLNGGKYHFQLLMSIIGNLDREMTTAYGKHLSDHQIFDPAGTIFDQRFLQVSYLSDSIFFHLGSCFDYLSSLIEFIYNHNKDAQRKWMQIAKASRDTNNPFSKTTVAKIIDKLDRKFIGKLYDHRSYLIHTRADKKKGSYNLNVTQAQFKTKILSSDKFNGNFMHLNNLAKEYDITLKFAMLWVLKESLSSINSVLFALKDYLENNKKIDILPLFFEGPNKEMLPLSINYWNNLPNI
jgi:hypothetical protein